MYFQICSVEIPALNFLKSLFLSAGIYYKGKKEAKYSRPLKSTQAAEILVCPVAAGRTKYSKFWIFNNYCKMLASVSGKPRSKKAFLKQKFWYQQTHVTLLTFKFLLSHPSAIQMQPKCPEQTVLLGLIKRKLLKRKHHFISLPFHSFICLVTCRKYLYWHARKQP